MPTGQSSEIMAISPGAHAPLSKYERLIARAKEVPPASAIIVHPCDETSLRGPIEAAEAGIIGPIPVGPAAKISAVAREHHLDISRIEIVDVVPYGGRGRAARNASRQNFPPFLLSRER